MKILIFVFCVFAIQSSSAFALNARTAKVEVTNYDGILVRVDNTYAIPVTEQAADAALELLNKGPQTCMVKTAVFKLSSPGVLRALYSLDCPK